MIGTNNENIYTLGLLYLYKYSNKTCSMIAKDDLDRFVLKIEEALNKYNQKTDKLTYIDQLIIETPIYYVINDNQTTVYYVLKPGIDMKLVERKLASLPAEYYQALQEDSTLEPLGLINYNNEIVLKSNITRDNKNSNKTSVRIRK